MLRGHRSDDQRSGLIVDAAQLTQILQIYQVLGLGEAQLHHRDQTVPAGNNACILPLLR